MAGGASNEISVLKTGRLHQIVMQNRLPTVTLTQTVSHGHEYLIEPAYIYVIIRQELIYNNNFVFSIEAAPVFVTSPCSKL